MEWREAELIGGSVGQMAGSEHVSSPELQQDHRTHNNTHGLLQY